MKFNNYFFKKHWHTLRKNLFSALQRAQKTVFEFLERLPSTENVRLWLRENISSKNSEYFLKTLYGRLIVRGEYTKRDLVVFFIVAFIVGIAGKTVAMQNITIGFDDYRLPPKETLVNFNDIQKKITEQGSAFIESNSAQGGVCSE